MELTKEEREQAWRLLQRLSAVPSTYTLGDNNWERVYKLTLTDIYNIEKDLREFLNIPRGYLKD